LKMCKPNKHRRTPSLRCPNIILEGYLLGSICLR
jgi:hypothetical protein